MPKLIYLDHREDAENNAKAMFQRFGKEIPELQITLKGRYSPSLLESDYDFYFLHTSTIEHEQIEQLRQQHPSALIVGFSGCFYFEETTPSHLKECLDVYAARDMSEKNLDYLLRILKSRLNKNSN